MKRIFRYLILLLIFFSYDVLGTDDTICQSNEFERIKDLAKKVAFSYDTKTIEYSDIGCFNCKMAISSITAYNLSNNLAVRIIYDEDALEYQEFTYNDNKTFTLENFEGGKVNITIKAFVPNACSGKIVLKKTIELPYYNYFYNNDECRLYPQFKYCNEYIPLALDEERFLNLLNDYKASLQINEDNSLIFKSFFDYKNIIIIVLITCLGVGGLIFIVKLIIRKRVEENI